MKSFQIAMVIFLSVCCLITSTPVSAKDVLEIINKVDSVSRESFSSQITKIKLSTCRYEVNQGSMSCVDNPRVSVLEMVQKHYGNKNRDTRSISIVLEPVGDKGIGMLSYEYFDPGKDNDAWLYLSTIGKVKRLISSSEDSDGSGSFFGSEFSVEDMTLRKVKDYTYKLLREDTYNKRQVWVVESVPTSARARKSAYGKIESFIDKERYIVLKENMFDHNGKLFKQQTRRDIELISNVWVVKTTTMNNLSSRRVTDLKLITVGYNMEVTDDFLTQRSLTDFAFREKNLTKYRTFMK